MSLTDAGACVAVAYDKVIPNCEKYSTTGSDDPKCTKCTTATHYKNATGTACTKRATVANCKTYEDDSVDCKECNERYKLTGSTGSKTCALRLKETVLCV